MKIYIAASIVDNEEVKKYRDRLEGCGFECTSTWLTVDYTGKMGDPLSDPQLCLDHAQQDLYDIDRSDIVLYLGGTKHSSGKLTELGYCIGIKKPVLFVATPSTVFHYCKNVIHFEDFDHALNYLVNSKRIVEAFTA